MKILSFLTTKIIIAATLFFGLAVAAIVFALPLMLLWNGLMPDIFGLTEISFLQAIGINFLSGILFSNSNND